MKALPEKTEEPRPQWGPSILKPYLKEWLIWRALMRALNRETKHETDNREDPGGPEG